jgi:hypothetical protein
MKCKICGLMMELWQSSTDESGNLYLSYRCSCGYQDSNIKFAPGNASDTYAIEPEQPKGKPSKVDKWD